MNDTLDRLIAAVKANKATVKEPSKCVVRVTTSNYLNGGEIVFKKTLRVLKRRSQLSLYENGIDDIEYVSIPNLNEVEDGIYELQPSEYDWDGDEYCTYQYPVAWKLVPVDE